jgi:hypothetical protein
MPSGYPQAYDPSHIMASLLGMQPTAMNPFAADMVRQGAAPVQLSSAPPLDTLAVGIRGRSLDQLLRVDDLGVARQAESKFPKLRAAAQQELGIRQRTNVRTPSGEVRPAFGIPGSIPLPPYIG